MAEAEEDSEVVQWLRDQMKEEWEKMLAEQPWWCLLCGEGGNYEGELPDEYWVPPADHICKPKEPVLMGVGTLTPITISLEDPRFDAVKAAMFRYLVDAAGEMTAFTKEEIIAIMRDGVNRLEEVI